jgi:repressor LexA
MTDRQRAVLDAVEGFIAEHGYSPSVRYLCRIVERSSSSSVWKQLFALRRDGYVTWIEGTPRTLRVLRSAPASEVV